jgi:hypothetical protein
VCESGVTSKGLDYGGRVGVLHAKSGGLVSGPNEIHLILCV